MYGKRRTAWGLPAAWAAVAAILLQVVIGAMPVQAQASQTIEICTAHGSKTVSVDQAGAPAQPQKAPCPHCDHCLAAFQAAPAVAPIIVSPVRYGRTVTHSAGKPQRFAPARAPPRPPGQGPPQILNA